MYNRFESGFEKYDTDGNVDQQASIDHMISLLEKRNHKKYSWFLKSLVKVKQILRILLVSHLSDRCKILYLTYFALRWLDDIIDGDSPITMSTKQRHDLIQDKVTWLKEGDRKNWWRNTDDLFDSLVRDVFSIAERIWILKHVKQWIYTITESLVFDAQRILEWEQTGSIVIKTEKKLQDNFHKLDIDGTIRATAILVGLNPEEAIAILWPLGDAARYAYTLMDFLDDMKGGLDNISQEDMLKYDISYEDLQATQQCTSMNDLPLSIIHWCEYMISEIDYNMAYYYENKKSAIISLSYSKNSLLQYLYNKVLHSLILPKGYIEEINDVKKGIMQILENRIYTT